MIDYNKATRQELIEGINLYEKTLLQTKQETDFLKDKIDLLHNKLSKEKKLTKILSQELELTEINEKLLAFLVIVLLVMEMMEVIF